MDVVFLGMSKETIDIIIAVVTILGVVFVFSDWGENEKD
jgi:hypothetical protein